ncbi:MAG: TrkH family potassium uptake protein, partial [Clostridiales bacterium]|nr:TrkH family potassium uptake protein [Clostridiales bacterium]
MPDYNNASDALRDAVFNVNSVMSTTGFCTVDFNKWNSFSKLILIFLMIIGGCAGSTGGGIKVTRVIVYVKEMFAELRRALRPRTVTKIRVNSSP